jgi:hypothetical protein
MITVPERLAVSKVARQPGLWRISIREQRIEGRLAAERMLGR